MKIIAIDPGYERLGIAVLEKEEGGKEKLLFSECFKTSANFEFPDRLFLIAERVEDMIKKYDPEVLVIEGLFFSKNTKTALKVSEVRGAIIYIAKKLNLEIKEYTPNQIKIAITGYGQATKRDIAFLLPKLIKLNDRKKIDDEMDAIAIGLTFFAMERFNKSY